MSVTQTIPSTEQLAYEKFLFDSRMAEADLQIRQAEATRLAAESARSTWTNPIVVAVIGAILVGMGNVVVSDLNALSQQNISAQISAANGDIEANKSERTSVLEILKGSDPENIRAKLCLLLKLNQIPSQQTNKAVLTYLKANKGCDPAPSAPDPFMSAAASTQHAASANAGGEVQVASGASSVGAQPRNTTPAKPIEGTWISTSLVVPGCGDSGCYTRHNVCGAVSAGMRATGNIRSSTDSFAGWGDWIGDAVVSDGTVCRTYQQHSHNQTRVVSYQFEVVPK
jgi:hypothetical protein